MVYIVNLKFKKKKTGINSIVACVGVFKYWLYIFLFTFIPIRKCNESESFFSFTCFYHKHIHINSENLSTGISMATHGWRWNWRRCERHKLKQRWTIAFSLNSAFDYGIGQTNTQIHTYVYLFDAYTNAMHYIGCKFMSSIQKQKPKITMQCYGTNNMRICANSNGQNSAWCNA